MLNKPKILVIHNQFSSDVARKYGLYGGVGYYRQIMPAKHLKEYTFVHVGKELLKMGEKEIKDTVFSLVKDCQCVYTKHLDNPYAIVPLLGACDYYKIPLIVDFDDHVFTTDGLSPDKYAYEKGSFQYYCLNILLKEATAITVSTKPLVDVYKVYNPSVYLAPNYCDAKDWKQERRYHQRKTVGWAGSASHFKDHPVLEEVYAKVIEKHPDVVFSFVGHMLPEHLPKMPRKNWEIKPGISWWADNPENKMTYPRLLAECGYDVGLAPLIQSQFNTARSLAKWFEYSMVGTPVVASRVGPYLALRDKEDAYLVQTPDEWVSAIDYLLINEQDGERIISNSRKRIAKEYSIAKNIQCWREVFESRIGNGFK